ncbi:hypothetical protein GWI33_016615 [Rhynchophorus ferrugineus]|uniref:Uncharacterized protein n=1 Tax=Rhynchophorus ferrugineus TaxID=354439 RepID=A0A834M8G9_RHYFE|nr:hypothetical protein GWI33_016615 [Rhynchophorus ferrugineus]
MSKTHIVRLIVTLALDEIVFIPSVIIIISIMMTGDFKSLPGVFERAYRDVRNRAVKPKRAASSRYRHGLLPFRRKQEEVGSTDSATVGDLDRNKRHLYAVRRGRSPSYNLVSDDEEDGPET